MRMLRSAFGAVALAAVALAACQPAAKTPPPAKTGLSIAPLSFTERTLPNGLRVYAMPDGSTASASVEVRYDVGGRDDPPGRSGFAHLFEHIMFKATANTPAEFFDRLTEDVGGINNASTSDDYTNYFETVPANHLERILWAEAQRMGSLVVDADNFKSEREVVKEEFRQSVLSSPYGKLFYLYLPQAFYDVHPYGRSVIGSIKDLDAATIEDVRQFHAAYYRPDNAVLVVSGNFDPKQLDAWVDTYFASIAKPARPLDRTQVTEPKRAAPKSVTVYEPNVPLPAVAISYLGPDARSPDYAAWIMMDAILSRGQSSRLYQSLVYEKKLASQVMTFQSDNQTRSAYSLIAILSEGKSPDDGVAALKAEIAKLRDADVSAAELDEARNELITAVLRGRETSDGRAGELAANVVLRGDPKAGDAMLAKLQTITAADIRAFAQKLLDDTSAVTIRYLPEGMADKGVKSDTIAASPKTEAKAISIPAADIPTYALAAEDKREKPPEPGQPIQAKIPGASEKMLANGLRVIVANKPGLPLISANLRMGAGAGLDPIGKAGLAAMTADVAQRGTETRSATDIARQVESLGADLSAHADADGSAVSVSTRSDKAADVFAILADIVQHPAFKDEELDRARQETLDGLKVQLASPRGLGQRAMSRLLFGDDRYGKVATPKSIASITATDIADFAKAHWSPRGAVLVIAGDITPEAGFKLAEDAFGGWTREITAAAKLQPATVPMGPRAVAIDMPRMGQAFVAYGLQGPARRDGDYVAALLATEVLGGGYSSRLNRKIRIEKGLSYGAYANFGARVSAPPLLAYAQTRNDAVGQVVKLAADELTKIGAEPIPAAELDARKAVLIAGFGRSVETTSGLAGELGELAQFGLPLRQLQSYQADVAAVTPDQAYAAAKQRFVLANANLVVVGDASVFWPALKAERPKAERIPAKDLNLDSPTLK